MVPDYQGARVRIALEGDLALPASVVTIGGFDGVHRGHQALISGAIRRARALQVPALAWTFDPLPKVAFGRARPLAPLGERLARIAALGPDWILVAPFTAAYAARSPAAFLAALRGVGAREVHVGGDFRFGAGQAGDVALLARAFPTVVRQPVLCPAGRIVSSTRIRALRAAGDGAAEAALLQGGTGAFLAGLIMLAPEPQGPHA